MARIPANFGRDAALTPSNARVSGPVTKGSLRDRIAIADAEKERVHIILDVSISMDCPIEDSIARSFVTRLQAAKNAIRELLGISDRSKSHLGLISFSTKAQVHQEPTPNFDRLQYFVDRLDTGGCTNMAEALRVGLEQAPNRVILVSDGEPDSEAATLIQARRYAERKIPIDAIYIGLPDEDGALFLRKLCEMTRGMFSTAETVNSLHTALARLETTSRLMIEDYR